MAEVAADGRAVTDSPVDLAPAQPEAMPLIVLSVANADRYLSLVERIMFEQLSGVERVFGRDEAVGIVLALAKKYPAASP